MIHPDQLLEQLRAYEGKWVAVLELEDETKVVASGNDACEAKEEAEKKGYADVALLKVLPFDAAYVPLA